ncbi:MAG: helix-turn-helix domain-containing protein [candidate division WOR-3 bacterium]
MLHKNKVSFQTKIEAVKKYYKQGLSLRKTAEQFGISYKTLWFWIRRYNSGGIKALNRSPGRAGIPSTLAKKICMLKEREPGLTIIKATKILKQNGEKVSKNTVWRVWNRCYMIRRPLDNVLTTFCSKSDDLELKVKQAEDYLKQGKIKSAAKIINDLFYIPETDILLAIPDSMLSYRRRLDKLYLQVEKRFENTNFSDFAEDAKKIARTLEKENYYWSSMLAYFLVLIALTWLGRPREKLVIHSILHKRIKDVRDPALRFNFYHQLANTYLDLLMVHRARPAIEKCRRLLYQLPDALYWESFADMLSRTLNNITVHHCYMKAVEYAKDPIVRDRLNLKIASCLALMGDTKECRKYLNLCGSIKNSTVFSGSYWLANAYYHFSRGDIFRAREHYMNALKSATRDQILNRLIASSIGLAAVAMALNQPKEAMVYLLKYLPLVRKYRMYREMISLKSFAGMEVKIKPEVIKEMPRMKLLVLLNKARKTKKSGDYLKAINYASKKKYMGFFIQHIVFYPDLVLNVLSKGKSTKLPAAVLHLPIFNTKTYAYRINFLGKITVLSNQEYMKGRLSPKDAAILLFIVSRIYEPDKLLELCELYKNFWHNNPKPARLFSHSLVRIKKQLRIPSHYLEVKRQAGESYLINQNLYFTTDYQEFNETLARAKALQRAGEWGFARKEYLRAFRLFRGEPFKKNFDNWSVDMRFKILSQFETEAINFAKSCLEHGNKNDARKILQKVLKIIPDSEEARKLSDNLIV